LIFSGRVTTTLVMLTVFAGMALMAIHYPPKARFMPLLVAVPATIMCLAQLVIDIRRSLRESSNGAPLDAGAIADRPREIKMFFWLAMFFAGIIAFGFLYATPVLIAAFLRFGERESWTTSIVAAVASFAVLYLVFVRTLELFLFDGLVTPLIFG
jgi:hypothetical protein